MTTLTMAEVTAATDLYLGTSDWLLVDQDRIDAFAEATGDRQWIHVDPERAKGGPYRGTIAHGYLTLSLLPSLMPQVLTISDARMRVNYGADNLRFPAPVPVGSKIRLKAMLLGAEPKGDGQIYRVRGEIEVQGQDKPAMVGTFVYIAY